MATRTVYTSTVTVPVFASWKCEECGEVNCVSGVIVCKRQASSASMFHSKQESARKMASNQAKSEWTEDALKIISDPNSSGALMYSNLLLKKDTKCSKCAKKPRWYQSEKTVSKLQILSMMIGVVSGLIAITSPTDVIYWLIFGVCAIVFSWTIIREIAYKKMMKKLPKEYTPVIGSLNPELIEYANACGKKIPNIVECIAAVKGENQVPADLTLED